MRSRYRREFPSRCLVEPWGSLLADDDGMFRRPEAFVGVVYVSAERALATNENGRWHVVRVARTNCSAVATSAVDLPKQGEHAFVLD